MYERVLYEGEVYSRLGLSIKHLVGMVWYARCELPFACLLRAARMDILQQVYRARNPTDMHTASTAATYEYKRLLRKMGYV